MTFQHHVSELVAIKGTKLRLESGPSMDQVIFQPPTQLATQSPTQLHKISLPFYCIRYFTDQVGEQVPATNHREHRGHRDIAYEITNLKIHYKPCDELNTAFNPQLGHVTGIIEVNYDN